MKRNAKPLRVGLVLPNLEWGGAERQAVALALELHRAGWNPVVIVAEMHGPLLEQLRAAGIRVHDLKAAHWRSKNSSSFWMNLFATVLRLRTVIRRERLAVCHSWLFWQNVLTVPAAMLAMNGCKIVTGRRSMGAYKDHRRWYQLMENISNIFTDRIVCNSTLVREDALSREKFIEGKISTISNGIDLRRFHPLNQQLGFLAVEDQAIVIGTVGNMKREKRHDVFLSAFAIVAAEFLHTRAVIVGADRGEHQSLAATADNLFITDRVEFPGASEITADLYHDFDIFVLTSEEEGMPNVLLEAMACGRAIVATDVGGVRELVADGSSGLVVKRNSPVAIAAAISTLIRDPAMRERFGAAAAIRSRKFDATTMAAKYMKLYHSVVRI